MLRDGDVGPGWRATTRGVELDADLLDEVKDAVVYLSGPPYRLTIRALIERAAEKELRRLRAEVLGGRQFPPREQQLRAGRPVT